MGDYGKATGGGSSHGAMSSCGGASWQKSHRGNKYRAKNDDGSKQSRKRTGGQSHKHTSPVHNPGYH